MFSISTNLLDQATFCSNTLRFTLTTSPQTHNIHFVVMDPHAIQKIVTEDIFRLEHWLVCWQGEAMRCNYRRVFRDPLS